MEYLSLEATREHIAITFSRPQMDQFFAEYMKEMEDHPDSNAFTVVFVPNQVVQGHSFKAKPMKDN